MQTGSVKGEPDDVRVDNVMETTYRYQNCPFTPENEPDNDEPTYERTNAAALLVETVIKDEERTDGTNVEDQRDQIRSINTVDRKETKGRKGRTKSSMNNDPNHVTRKSSRIAQRTTSKVDDVHVVDESSSEPLDLSDPSRTAETISDSEDIESDLECSNRKSKKTRKVPLIENLKSKQPRFNPIIREEGDRILYECRDCNKIYGNLKRFKAHTYDHKGEHVCPVCQSRFSRKSNLKAHMQRHDSEKNYACHVCPTRFSTAGDLSRHLAVHGAERKFKCLECDKMFLRKAHLNDHMLSHSVEKPCKCPVCGLGYTKPHNLRFHMRQHVEEKPIGCTLCRARFWRPFDLKRHVTTHRKTESSMIWECTQCEETFEDEGAVERHQCLGSEAPRMRDYQCTVCGGCYKSDKNLAIHMRNHRKEKRHKCPQCTARFWTGARLKRHIVCHGVDERYRCPKCGSCFRSQLGMTKHLKKCNSGERDTSQLIRDLSTENDSIANEHQRLSQFPSDDSDIEGGNQENTSSVNNSV